MAKEKKAMPSDDTSTAWVKDGKVYVRKIGTSIYVKTADFARLIGKTNQWVGQLVAQGTIVRDDTEHGSLLELGRNMTAYIQYLESRNAEKKEDKIDLEKRRAESVLKKAKAAVAMMQANELRGTMHRAEDVEAMTTDLLMSVRGILLALPGRLATIIAPEMTPAMASELIKTECESAMKEISEYKYDPKKYAERVRERQNWDTPGKNEDDADDD